MIQVRPKDGRSNEAQLVVGTGPNRVPNSLLSEEVTFDWIDIGTWKYQTTLERAFQVMREAGPALIQTLIKAKTELGS